MSPLLVVHAAATWFMVGLIWMIQIVHYPLFDRVGTAAFPGYERAHMTRMGRLLVVPAVIEVVAAALVFVALPGDVSRVAAAVGGALLAAIWLGTAVVQVPQHRALGRRFVPAVYRRLVRDNWWRTAGWSLRGLIAAAMLG